MKYFVYVLVSLQNNDLYIGNTANIKSRLTLHNSGRVRSTKGYKPWKLLETREFASRGEAVRMERFLKDHQQKEILKKKYGAMAKR